MNEYSQEELEKMSIDDLIHVRFAEIMGNGGTKAARIRKQTHKVFMGRLDEFTLSHLSHLLLMLYRYTSIPQDVYALYNQLYARLVTADVKYRHQYVWEKALFGNNIVYEVATWIDGKSGITDQNWLKNNIAKYVIGLQQEELNDVAEKLYVRKTAHIGALFLRLRDLDQKYVHDVVSNYDNTSVHIDTTERTILMNKEDFDDIGPKALITVLKCMIMYTYLPVVKFNFNREDLNKLLFASVSQFPAEAKQIIENCEKQSLLKT